MKTLTTILLLVLVAGCCILDDINQTRDNPKLDPDYSYGIGVVINDTIFIPEGVRYDDFVHYQNLGRY